jgi:hypothetical protein
MTEDQQATLDRYKEHLEYYRDALAKADKLIPDMVVKGRYTDGTLVQMYRDSSPDELDQLAKVIEEMADMRRYLAREERRMKEEGLTLETL